MSNSDPASDPRWSRLLDGETICSGCGQIHRGLFDLVSSSPAYWRGDPAPVEPDKINDLDNFLTSDMCVMAGKDFFVRCVLLIPIHGQPGMTLGFGVWSTLSKSNFMTYNRNFSDPEQSRLGPWFGWFSNQLAGYPNTLELGCAIHLQDGRQRPSVVLETTDHPLTIEQRDGLTLDRLFEIYSLRGHDFGVG